MTEIEQLEYQMEAGPRSRRTLAEELYRARRILDCLQRHQRRLPHQVQTVMRAPALAPEIDPPAEGALGLFSHGRTA